MTEQTFNQLATAMKTLYSSSNFLPDKYAAKLWYSLVKDIPDEVATTAVQQYMQTGKFPPTPADIREIAAKIMTPHSDEMSELEAWSLVYKAACRLSPDAESARRSYEQLPESCQKALGSPMALYEIGFQMTEDAATTVGKSQFLRSYRTVKDRMDSTARLSQSVINSVERIKMQADMQRLSAMTETGLIGNAGLQSD